MSEWRTDLPFAPVPDWVTDLPISDRALRLYAFLAGMRDYETGQASYGRKLLAKKLRCSDDSLDRAKAELEKHGAISVERRESNGGAIPRNIYTINRIPAGSRIPAATEEPEVPAQERLPDTRTGAATNEKNGSTSSSSSSGARLPLTCAGKTVTKAEHDLVDQVMEVFNRIASKRFAGREWRESIVRRVREHPELTAEDHERIIKQQFEKPWWKGDPTPSVVYGNGKVFDRALNGVQAEKRERKWDTDGD